jgi:hypothetical protein
MKISICPPEDNSTVYFQYSKRTFGWKGDSPQFSFNHYKIIITLKKAPPKSVVNQKA